MERVGCREGKDGEGKEEEKRGKRRGLRGEQEGRMGKGGRCKR